MPEYKKYDEFEPPFKIDKNEASELEAKVKSRYNLRDFTSPDGTGYALIDKKSGNEIYFSPNSRLTLETRYLEKDRTKKVTENALDLFTRVAVNIAAADRKYDANADTGKTAEEFLEMMLYKEFMPNTPTLCNAGRSLQQLSACFVLPIDDYMATDDIGEDPEKQGEGIYDMLRAASMIHKSGGGTGFNFSYLRSKGDNICTTFGSSSGPVSFLKSFDAATHAVNQGGFRRGANMGILEYWHPDIFEFVHEKINFAIDEKGKKKRSLSNFNLSVGVDDKFMNLAANEGYFPLISPKNRKKISLEERVCRSESLIQMKTFDDSIEGKRKKGEYNRLINEMDPSLMLSEDGKDVINRYNNEVVGKIGTNNEVLISANVLFDYIARNAWETGCPGIVFLDNINKDNPTPQIGRIDATNPCGEQPLLPFESCNLGGINLASCVSYENEKYEIDYKKIENLSRKGVHFLDNVIDMNEFPFKKIFHMAKGNRKIGLGMMGWAEMLYKLKIPYDSQDALDLAEKVSSFITEKGRDESCRLAEKRGAFPNWKGSVYDPDSPYAKEGKKGFKVRNATITTIAPNGTTGMIADASSGIEPTFLLYYEKTCMDGRTLKYKITTLYEELKNRSLDSESITNQIEDKGSVQDVKEIPDDIKKIFKTAMDISPEWHVKMQAAFQRGIDNAVSKTVNLPFEATVDEIKKIYLDSWRYGCKGITIFRDQSREEQVLSRKKSDLVELVQNEVNLPPTIKKAVNSGKYKVKRRKYEDTLHLIVADDLYIDDKEKKAYFLPRETFLERANLGTKTSVDWQQSGIDRSEILKGPDPDYAELITRWKSPSTAEEEEGLGPNKLKSSHHVYGLVLETHLLANGVVAYDNYGLLYNVVKKKNLRHVTDENEQRKILSSRFGNGKTIEQNVAGNIILDKPFECAQCGSRKFFFESGCHHPKCKECGWSDGSCG